MRVSVCHAPPPLNRSHRLPYQGTADYELFFLLLLVGTAETIGFKQIYGAHTLKRLEQRERRQPLSHSLTPAAAPTSLPLSHPAPPSLQI